MDDQGQENLTGVTEGSTNSSLCGLSASNWTNYSSCHENINPAFNLDVSSLITIVIYSLICVAGLLGNGLVIFVILRYTKMKTVTNLYILNLSIADTLFLFSLPLTIVTTIVRNWVFGYTMCKIYYMLYCINMYTSALTLAAMSGDRFLAVVYPINSLRYRTSRHAQGLIAVIWSVSILFTIPALLYAKETQNPRVDTQFNCNIHWPDGGLIPSGHAYICYTLILGFAMPLLIISVLYSLLIIRLRHSGPAIRSAEKKRSQRRITKLVTLIIIMYIICWLPYWSFQVYLILPSTGILVNWQIYLYQLINTLSYLNSSINPFLYAFTNTNFRESFVFAFHCQRDPILHGFGRKTSDVTNTLVEARKTQNGDEGYSAVGEVTEMKIME